MASPLEYFRRYQKQMLVVITLFAIFAFVASDLLVRIIYGGAGFNNTTPVARAWGQTITYADTEQLLEDRNYANRFLLAAMQATNSRHLGIIRFIGMFPMGELTERAQELLLLRYAERLGIEVTNKDVSAFINFMTEDRLSPAEFRKILQGDPNVKAEGLEEEELAAQKKGLGISEKRLFDILTRELKIIRVVQLFSRGQYLAPTTPLQVWMQRRAQLATMKIQLASQPIEPYLKDLETLSKEREAEIQQELRTLYDLNKDIVADPTMGVIGFRQPEQAVAEFIVGNVDDFDIQTEITEERLRQHYEATKEQYEKTEINVPEVPPGFGETVPAPPAVSDLPPIPASPMPPAPMQADPPKESAPPSPAAAPMTKPAPDQETPAPNPAAAPAPMPTTPATEKPATESKPEPPPSQSVKQSSRWDAWFAVPTLVTVFQDPNQTVPDQSEPKQSEPKQTEPKPTASDPPQASAPAETPSPTPVNPDPSVTKSEPEAASGAPAPANPLPMLPPAQQPPQAPPPPTLNQTQPPAREYKPFEEVREQVRTSLRRKIAMETIQQRFQQLLTQEFKPYQADMKTSLRQYERTAEIGADGKPDLSKFQPPVQLNLQELANQVGMKAGATGLVSKASLEENDKFRGLRQLVLGDNPFAAPRQTFPQWLFESDRYAADLFQNLNGDLFYLMMKTEAKPSYVPAFLDVDDQVLETWKVQEASRLARAKVEEVISLLKGQENPDFIQVVVEHGLKNIPVPPFQPANAIPGMRGMGTQLVEINEIPNVPDSSSAIINQIYQMPENSYQAIASKTGRQIFLVHLQELQEPSFAEGFASVPQALPEPIIFKEVTEYSPLLQFYGRRQAIETISEEANFQIDNRFAREVPKEPSTPRPIPPSLPRF